MAGQRSDIDPQLLRQIIGIAGVRQIAVAREAGVSKVAVYRQLTGLRPLKAVVARAAITTVERAAEDAARAAAAVQLLDAEVSR